MKYIWRIWAKDLGDYPRTTIQSIKTNLTNIL